MVVVGEKGKRAKGGGGRVHDSRWSEFGCSSSS